MKDSESVKQIETFVNDAVGITPDMKEENNDPQIVAFSFYRWTKKLERSFHISIIFDLLFLDWLFLFFIYFAIIFHYIGFNEHC